MLIRFRARNFRSLKDEQELSLVASSLKDRQEAVTPVEGLDLGLVRVAAIYGANASGKSNVVKALAYMSSAVQNSQRQWAPEGPIPREPFLLDPQSRLDPSTFEVDLLLNGVRFDYGFTLNDREVLAEWLDAYPMGNKPIRKQMWFKREGRTFKFGNKLRGDNAAIERLTRSNSLFLSAAAQNGHEALMPLFKWFAERFEYVPRERDLYTRNFAEMCRTESIRSMVLQDLRAADLGVVGLEVRQGDLLPPLPAKATENDQAFAQEIKEVFDRAATVLRKFKGESSLQTPALSLIHSGVKRSQVPLSMDCESDGTVALLGLWGPVFRAVGQDGTLCVDELDASLHPLLALEVVHLFNHSHRGPSEAQIIFTTHDTNILDKASLRRDQIWFTEKDSEGATHLYPLTDFKPRKNENLERGYLQGRYGAVPFLGSSGFLADPDPNQAGH